MKRRDFLRGLAVAVAAVSIGSSPAVAAPDLEPGDHCPSFEKTMRDDILRKVMLSQDKYVLKGMADAVKSMKGLVA